jgi:hypothetical protein
LSESDKE